MLLEGETLAMSDWETLEDRKKLLDAAGETESANVTVNKKKFGFHHTMRLNLQIKSPNNAMGRITFNCGFGLEQFVSRDIPLFNR